MADILDGLASLSPQELSLEQRRAAKVRQIADGARQLLLSIAQTRKQLHAAVWSDPGLNPVSVAAALGADRTYSLFARDRALARFLAGQLADAGVPADTIAALVPGVPDQWVVTVDDAARTVSIAPKE